MTRRRDRSEQLYRALLRVYPEHFRDLYGRDTLELFRDRLAEARLAGTLAVWGLWFRTVPDVVLNGVLERVTGAGGWGGETVRSALRSVLRAPGLSATIVLTLGVGIGANVALYATLRGVLLRPLPYPEAERLVQLWETNPDVDDELHGPSPWNFTDWEASAASFSTMAAFYLTSGTYRTDAWVEELRSAQVTADFFRTMGAVPLLGRDFPRGEVDEYGPVMLSHGAWLRLFGGDPSVVGQSIVSSGNSYEIVGVMPPDFAYPDKSVETWVAWNMPMVYRDNPSSRTWRFLNGVARLADGASIQSAEEELDAIAASLSETYPVMNRGWGTAVTSLHEDTVGDVRSTLWLAFGAGLFILLIACANVANLLLARLPARLRDCSIRTTLGAPRARIARELLLENLALGLTAGLVGLVFGQLLIDLIVSRDAGQIPRLAEVTIDPGVVAFTVSMGLVTSLLFGAAPVFALVRGSRHGAMKHGVRQAASRRQRRARETFVGAQLAVTLILLAGAGLFASSLSRLMRVDPGIEAESVAAFRVSLDPVDGTAEEIVNYYRDLVSAVEAIPGVVSAGAAQTLALNPIANDFQRPYRPSGSNVLAAEASTVQMRIVTPGYASTIGMRFLDGEGIPEDAAMGEPLVAVVNRTLAERLWPDGNAVGRTFEIDFRDGWQPYTVTGVVQDVRHYGLREDVAPEVFLSHAQVPYLAMNVIAKTAGDPEEMFEPLKATVLQHVPMQPPHDFVSLDDLVAASAAEERFLSIVLALFAGVGLLLAGTGVYGVIAYTVGHQRREIGVRMALGAEPEVVVRTVIRQAILVASLGTLVGGVGIVALGGLVEGLLFGISAYDPTTTILVGVLLMLTSGIAAWLPARRAAWIPPAEALRSD